MPISLVRRASCVRAFSRARRARPRDAGEQVVLGVARRPPRCRRGCGRAGTPPTGTPGGRRRRAGASRTPRGRPGCGGRAARPGAGASQSPTSTNVVNRSAWSGKLALEPVRVRALLAPAEVLLVQRLDPAPREARVVQLRRLPRLAGVGERRGIAGGVERRAPRSRAPGCGRGAGRTSGRRRRSRSPAAARAG